jgi:hypothetical protein
MNDGTGHFSDPTLFDIGSSPFDITIGDVNADGSLDIVTSSYQNSNVSLLLGNGDGTFQAPLQYAAGSGTTGVALTELNNDGLTDILATNTNGNSVTFLTQHPDTLLA